MKKKYEKEIQMLTDNHIKIIMNKKLKKNDDNMNPINHVAIIMDGNEMGIKI